MTSPPGSQRAFSLLELLVAISILAILATIATAAYQSHIQKAKVAAATADIMTIAAAINRYNTLYNSPPPDLATIGMNTMTDPWGQPYAYLSFTGLNGKGKMRGHVAPPGLAAVSLGCLF